MKSNEIKIIGTSEQGGLKNEFSSGEWTIYELPQEIDKMFYPLIPYRLTKPCRFLQISDAKDGVERVAFPMGPKEGFTDDDIRNNIGGSLEVIDIDEEASKEWSNVERVRAIEPISNYMARNLVLNNHAMWRTTEDGLFLQGNTIEDDTPAPCNCKGKGVVLDDSGVWSVSCDTCGIKIESSIDRETVLRAWNKAMGWFLLSDIEEFLKNKDKTDDVEEIDIDND